MIIEALGYRLEPTPWAEHAACAGADPQPWFPTRGGSTIEARAVCAGCPVTGECLAYALRWDIRHGIWGGMSERQRRQLRRGVAKARRLSGRAANWEWAR